MNNILKLTSFLIFAVSISILSGCKSGVSLSETDFKEMYSSNSNIHQPQYKVYHSSNEFSEIHYMFENKSLTYVPNKAQGDLFAQVSISWHLYLDYTSSQVSDSSSFVKIDTIASSDLKQLQGLFKIPVPQGANYILKITAIDLNNNSKTINFLNINKSNINSNQYFKVILKENNTMLFRNYFYKDEKLAIVYTQKPGVSVIGRNYQTLFPVSPPPFSLESPTPFDFDNYVDLEIQLDNDTIHFHSDSPGIFHFTTNPKQRHSGLSLFQYSDDFPEVNSTQEMLDPLRFLTSRKEYSKMKKYQDPKKAVDQFWLSTTPDEEKAKKLVKGFYNRVEAANYYYSSFKEGWKTDRGIIFIVFGPPSLVYRSLTGESWTYGEQSNYKSLTFNFTKVNNPFTNNDYVLQRSTVYKNPWYRAIDSWRQAKVTSLEY